LYRWRLRHKTSAWASGDPAGSRCEAARLERWRALSQHGTMARIAPARPATPHSTNTTFFCALFVFSTEIRNKREAGRQAVSQSVRTQNVTFSLAAKFAESPWSVATLVVNSEPHTGARPSVCLCVGQNHVTYKGLGYFICLLNYLGGRTPLPAELATVPFEFVLVRVRVLGGGCVGGRVGWWKVGRWVAG
jgi:hypothetical protein